MAAKSKSRPRPVTPVGPRSSKPAAAPPSKKIAVSSPPERTGTFSFPFWKTQWPAALIFLALPFALYHVALGFGYVLDDQMVIWDNAYVQKGFSGLREIFAYDSFMGYFKTPKFLLEGGRYRPLSLATFALEVQFFGKDQAAVGHFVNIVLYGLNCLFLYYILSGLFRRGENGKWWFSAAFLGGLFFLLHPLHVECVANIKGRDEILALTGSLGALYATLRYYDTLKSRWLIAAGLFLFIGCLAKENALTFLAVVPLTVAFFTNVSWGRNMRNTWPLWAAAFLFIIVRYRALGYMVNPGKSMNDLMNNPFLDMNYGEKLATIFLTLGWYLKLLFVPHPLTHDYYPYQVPKVNFADWRALLSLALHVGMAVWAVLNIKKRLVPAYSILFYLLTLSIVSNLFVSVGTFMNERFLYMPSVAFCLLAGWFLARWLPNIFKQPEEKPYVLGAALVLVVSSLFAWRTYTRVPDWKDALSLNTSAVRNSPGSARAHMFYASTIYQDVYNKTKDPQVKAAMVDTMEYHINKSLEIHPKYISGWMMKGAISAARFEQDHQMDKLFHNFDIVLDNAPYSKEFRKFFFEYMDYLAMGGGNPNKINVFAYRVGYERFYKVLKEPQPAIQILESALKTGFEDERVLQALSEIYASTGNRAKAEEMRQRYEKSKAMILR